MDDVIAAIATPPGQGAIALLRLSGKGSFEVAAKVFRPASRKPLAELPARFQVFGKIVDSQEHAIDEALLTKFAKPASFTGEDTVEITCHGGVLAARGVLEALLEAGARAAEGGEFTQRAFLNGKLDLTQAEAVMDLISAQTSLALRAANEQLSGTLGRRIEALRQSLISIIAHVEAYIDFPDEDIDPQIGAQLVERLRQAATEIHTLAATAEQGRILREGVRTVICGAPNTGKSSLLNVLLGFDRAIVSDQAGTTRDTIEEVINLRGLPLRLVDTAGLRGTADEVERQGIQRTEQQLASAELVLEVFDGSHSPRDNAPPVTLPPEARRLTVLNKADLGVHPDWKSTPAVPVSCLKREGIEDLTDRIVETLTGRDFVWGDHTVAVNARHRACLVRAEGYLREGIRHLEEGESPELTAIELRSALEAVGEIVGRTDVEEILGEIFATFCIGK